jgi:hypothetical protein
MLGSDWWNVRLVAAMLLVCMVGFGGHAFAQIPNVPSDQPAATLLLPYFEVNLDNPQAQNTLMSITNTSATAVLAHVVIWSDLSVHTLDFDVYLTGYDVWRINLANLLVYGIAGQSTASAGQDPSDTISPKGPLSQDINFASCNGFLPLPPVPPFQLTTTQLALTGQPVPGFGGLCAGLDHGDRIARGYITIDTVNQCSVAYPADPGYFGAGGSGIATNQNVLTGDAFYINKSTNQAVAQNLVSLPASSTDPLTTTAGNYTFYGRYDNWDAADNRYPTSTSFQARYIQGGSDQGQNFFTNGSSLIVWRDSKTVQTPFTCPVTPGSIPSWYPLSQDGIVIFNEKEQVVQPPSCTFSPCPNYPGLIPFPAETQKVKVGSADLPIPFLNGWLYLDLNTNVTGQTAGLTDADAAQAWVFQLFDNGAPNAYEIGEPAFKFDSASNANHFFPGGN